MRMHFEFTKQIQTTKNSIFYSLTRYNNDQIMAIGRRNFWNERLIKFMMLTNEFDVIRDDETFFLRGEDPRSFYHNGDLYIQDNYWNDIYLINMNNEYKAVKVNIDGKNLSFISHNNRLYFIYYMFPFILYEIDIETGEIFPVPVHDNGMCNDEYRGGTPGYQLNDNTYYGFGHRTYVDNEIMKHDVFYWEIHFADKPYIRVFDIQQPPGSLNICDPTSVVDIGDKKYLVTAESEYPWFYYQNYETNIYEICEMNI